MGFWDFPIGKRIVFNYVAILFMWASMLGLALDHFGVILVPSWSLLGEKFPTNYGHNYMHRNKTENKRFGHIISLYIYIYIYSNTYSSVNPADAS